MRKSNKYSLIKVNGNGLKKICSHLKLNDDDLSSINNRKAFQDFLVGICAKVGLIFEVEDLYYQPEPAQKTAKADTAQLAVLQLQIAKLAQQIQQMSK
jgi:hypothetical protein